MTGSIAVKGPRLVLWYASLARAKAVASRRYRLLHHAEVGANVKVVVAERLPRGALEGADYDDLLFGGLPEERPEVVGGRLSLSWARRATEAYASILDRFDAYTVSTAALAEELRAVRRGARVFVVPNGLSPSWVAQGRRLYRAWAPGDRRVMRFFPGSPTHDESFASIRPALSALLSAHPEVSLEMVGNLRWDPAGLPARRVRHVRPVPFEHLPSLLGGAWVNLWPRADSRFNRAKSPIKFLEAAAFGCPTVASSSCREAAIDGPGIAWAETPEQWIVALERLLDDGARARAGAGCRERADGASAHVGWRALLAAIDALRATRVAS